MRMKYLLIIILLSSCRAYYDGEGNRIPHKAVRILVRSQFVHIDTSQQKTLDKYFYVNRKSLN